MQSLGTSCIAVPDDRLAVLAKINNSVKTLPVAMEFVDIAGYVLFVALTR